MQQNKTNLTSSEQTKIDQAVRTNNNGTLHTLLDQYDSDTLAEYMVTITQRGVLTGSSLDKSPAWDIVRALVHYGISPDRKRLEDGRALLHVALTQRKRSITKMLLDHGADPNVQDESDDTPLHYAFGGIVDLNSACLLVQNKADPTIANWDNKTPFDDLAAVIAAQSSQPDDFSATPLKRLYNGGFAQKQVPAVIDEISQNSPLLKKVLIALARQGYNNPALFVGISL